MSKKTAWVALGVSLSFGIMAAAEAVADSVQMGNVKPVVVESVFCDNEYGTAMEAAILEGNLKQVRELFSRYDHAIDDVIAVGCQRVELSDKNVTYSNDIEERRSIDEMKSRMGQMGVYNGSAMLGLDSGDLHRMGFNSSVGISVRGNYYSVLVAGNYKVLGTPLMIAVRARRKPIVKKLLEMGANPNVFIAVANYNRADILSWNSSPYTYNSKMTGGPWGCKRSKTYLCALLDCYMKMTLLQFGQQQSNAADEDEIAKMLIEHGAGFIDEVDDYGRNMLWDIAKVESTYLLGEMVKRGFDVNHEDNQGNTILHYCLEEKSYVPNSRFIRKLEELGARQNNNPSNEDQDKESKMPIRLVSGTEQVPTSGFTYPKERQSYPQLTTPSSLNNQRPDNSVEIAALQHRLLALRMELEDARANRKIATL